MARRSLHYAWVVAIVTFVILLVTAGIRATPGVLMLSLEREFGWSRAVISSAVAVNIALFGLIGPFAASVTGRWGVRRVILGAVALLAASVALTTLMHTQWQLMLLWGVLVGTGTGVPRWCWPRSSRRDVRRKARTRPRCAVSGQRHGAVDLPSVTRGSGRVERVAFRCVTGVGGRRSRVRHRVDIHARSSRRSRPAAVRTTAWFSGCRRRVRWRRSRRSPWHRARVRSGCSPNILCLWREHERPHRDTSHRRVP